MQKYNKIASIIVLVSIFGGYLCGQVESMDTVIEHKFCKCLNETTGNLLIKCKCVNHELKEVPTDLPSTLNELIIGEASITHLRTNSFAKYTKSLRDLTLRDLRDLMFIENGVFDNMHVLRTIYIHYAPKLKVISPSLFHVNLPNLEILVIVRTGIKKPPNLRFLKTNNHLRTVDLENNQIENLVPGELAIRAESLQLNYNQITEVGPLVFTGAQIATVNMRGNRKLQKLDVQAFVGIKSLRNLDLSDTSIQNLPTTGLEELDVLKIENTYTMTVFPSIYNFKNIKEAWLTYPYHCCAFHFPKTHNPQGYEDHQILQEKLSKECKIIPLETIPTEKTLHSTTENFFGDEVFHSGNVTVGTKVDIVCGELSKNYLEVKCYPQPDAFNPCEDLMGNWTLRVTVWIVAIAALLGNMAVLFVLLSSRFRLTVPKFLMCNLATADFCMGLYLLLIALMDARSIGQYFNHAIFWQRGFGCKIAGFLTIFSCMLSVFTLMIITGERWYTITYAIHLNRRLKLGASANIMAVGWMFSVVMGALPLMMGTSGYSKTSICLPMENRTFTDKVYLFALLMFNGVAFVVICACYAKMYVSIRGGREAVASVARSDMTVAKRMALLVFTDFACWAPVAFFGLTALAGYPLIDVPQTKILLVFFYPLNSCANPYLYALLTQQYRRDLFVLLSRFGVCDRRANEYKGTGPMPCGRRKTYCNDPRYNDRRGGGGCGDGGYGGGGGGDDRGRDGGDNHHRGSLLTTVTSVDSVVACRPGSLTPLQELNNDAGQQRSPAGQVQPPQHLELLPLRRDSSLKG